MSNSELSGKSRFKHSKSSGIQVRPVKIAERMFAVVSATAPRLKSRFQTAFVRAMYSGIGIILKGEAIAFLNDGYVSLESDTGVFELDPKDEADRVSIQLYARVVDPRDLRDMDVLEVGCGRGGGASFIARYLHPRSVTGIDLSTRAVRFCRRTHRVKCLTFLRGEAENLPLESNSFDAVVNVESSHCYPSFDGFLGEVARTLRPNGIFLFADLRPREDVPRLRERLKERVTILEEEFITANVVRALEVDNDRRNSLIQKQHRDSFTRHCKLSPVWMGVQSSTPSRPVIFSTSGSSPRRYCDVNRSENKDRETPETAQVTQYRQMEVCYAVLDRNTEDNRRRILALDTHRVRP